MVNWPKNTKKGIQYSTGVLLTCINFIATNLNPFCSNRLMMSPIRPRWTPSGFTIIKVLSVLSGLFST